MLQAMESSRLAALVLAIGLTTSRLGLIAHELVGHGLIAVGLGGELTGWRLFAFGGGWVGFRPDPGDGQLALYLVQMGGIAVELVLAVACGLWARRQRGVAQLALASAAWSLVLHAGWYLSAGTFHGFGDGWLLHHRMGSARLAVVVPAAAAIIAGTYVAARRLTHALRGLTTATAPRRQLAIVAAALVLGIGGHAALTAGELQLRPDRNYRSTMRTAGQRAVDRDLAVEVARAEQAGRPLDRPAVARIRRDLDRRHRQFPFGALLVGAMALAAITGAAGSRPATTSAPPGRQTLAIAAALTAASIALVVLIDSLAP